MPIALKIPPALRRVFDDEAEAAFIDVLNQWIAAQHDGYERSLDTHVRALRKRIDRRFEIAEERTKLALQEGNEQLKRIVDELRLENSKRILHADAKNDLRFAEAEAEKDRHFAEAETRNRDFSAETDAKNIDHLAELERQIEKGISEMKIDSETQAAELKVSLEKRSNEFDQNEAERYASLIRWMFTFFLGTIFTLAGLLFAYVHLIVNRAP